MKSASRDDLRIPVEVDQPQDRRGREHGRQQTVLPNTVPDALTVRAHGATSHCGCDGCPPLPLRRFT